MAETTATSIAQNDTVKVFKVDGDKELSAPTSGFTASGNLTIGAASEVAYSATTDTAFTLSSALTATSGDLVSQGTNTCRVEYAGGFALSVGSTAGFPSSGTLLVGTQVAEYVGKTATSFIVRDLLTIAPGESVTLYDDVLVLDAREPINTLLMTLRVDTADASGATEYTVEVEKADGSWNNLGTIAMANGVSVLVPRSEKVRVTPAATQKVQVFVNGVSVTLSHLLNAPLVTGADEGYGVGVMRLDAGETGELDTLLEAFNDNHVRIGTASKTFNVDLMTVSVTINEVNNATALRTTSAYTAEISSENWADRNNFSTAYEESSFQPTFDRKGIHNEDVIEDGVTPEGTTGKVWKTTDTSGNPGSEAVAGSDIDGGFITGNLEASKEYMVVAYVKCTKHGSGQLQMTMSDYASALKVGNGDAMTWTQSQTAANSKGRLPSREPRFFGTRRCLAGRKKMCGSLLVYKTLLSTSGKEERSERRRRTLISPRLPTRT